MVDEQLMQATIRGAEKAGTLSEAPIGCVIARKGKIVTRGYNRHVTDRQTLAHAELFALRKACKKEGNWRLEDCTLYVTLEPRPMCAGAIVQTQIPRVVYGAFNPEAGYAGSVLDLLDEPRFNHQVSVKASVLENTCAALMRDFFWKLRTKRKAEQGEKRESWIIKKQFTDNLTLNLQIIPALLAKILGAYYV